MNTGEKYEEVSFDQQVEIFIKEKDFSFRLPKRQSQLEKTYLI